jgi:hypothetical protein
LLLLFASAIDCQQRRRRRSLKEFLPPEVPIRNP